MRSEAASFAGHQKLGNLCWVYDDNSITIEGNTELAFDENVGARFAAYGWHVHHVPDANDTRGLAQAFEAARKSSDAPTFIVVKSHIGYGAPHKQDTAAAHGEPLGEEEVRLAKRSYGWPEDAKFLVPDGVRENFDERFGKRGRSLHQEWKGRFEAYRNEYPDLAERLMQMGRQAVPDGWDADLPSFKADAKGLATRESSGKVLNGIGPRYPWLVGGAADLAPSTKTALTFSGADDLEPDHPGGRNLHFGIREHAMGAILNGAAVSNLRVYGSSFLIFSDYMRPPIRLSALMELPVIYIYTHDLIGLGEDGPTYQPIEQLAGLRSVPGLIVLRPADANEVVEAWRVIIGLTRNPACLVLTRQPLPTLDRSRYGAAAGADGVSRGAYVLADAADGNPSVILIGTGSEVTLCIEAYEQLKRENVPARVVSMPSWELFDRQDQSYRDRVFPPDLRARVSVEAASVMGWERYVGQDGAMIGMKTFGASAPIKDLFAHFGFTAAKVAEAAKQQIARHRKK